MEDDVKCVCHPTSCLILLPTNDALKNTESSCPMKTNGITRLVIVFFNDNKLTAETFDSFPKLTALDINQGKLSNIEPGAFEKTPNLTNLNIRYNNISTLEDNTFRGLNALEILCIVSGKLTTISPKAFNGLKNLSHLTLTANQLTQLPDNLFASSPSLTMINLAHNLLSTVLPAGIFNNIIELAQLDLSHNQLTAFKFPSLKASHVLLHNNSLTTLYLNDHFTLVEADHNRISKLSGTGAKLYTLQLTGNNLTDASPISRMINLTKLTLSNNPLQPNSVFNSLRRLEELLLSHTNITITNETFANMAELKLLDLSYNNLKELDFSMFSDLIELQTLIVAFNNIDKINFLEQREYLPNLQVLEICGNGWNATYLSHVLEYLKIYKLKADMYGHLKDTFMELCANGEQAPKKAQEDDSDSSMEGLPSIPLEQQFAEFYPSSTTTTTAKPIPSSTVSTTTPKRTTSKMTTTSTTGLPKPSAEPSVRLATDTMVPVVAPLSAANEQSAEVGSSSFYVTFQVTGYMFAVFGVVALGVVAYYMHQRRLDVRRISLMDGVDSVRLI
ncbi:leucine-rich repeat-containing G-protein coupled receptor 4-like [Anopheles ziemanni]|uniref:leucine-rich repeat-containing G-protein coupled receptor 4-like n=1 Tax=Anopheles coustani TaxID=139045 RepID=UPI00265884D5|nr:leucine-rich repeat-containing G-protein coupled receptor 4-like [Anopheles coustani]XP_058168945.1 leucine-rich repeat-containing G-protein coupled receptor 4-like [Anopheles ziemanni]